MEEQDQTQDYDIYKVSERVNYTDPIVRHDPTIEKQPVVKPDISDDENNVSMFKTGADMKKAEGSIVPIILVNSVVIDYQNIVSMKLNYDSFVPSIELIVAQNSKEIETSDTTGMDNIITVVMTSKVDGAFKPASINFYINQVKNVGNEIYYKGTYKLLSLEQNHTEQITFNPAPDAGCDAEFCQLPANEHPTTYEFLHCIAELTGLGFATTDQVKEIADDKYRFITNQNYKDAILQHVKFGGLDETSIFDCWVDLYRYLVVVNVAWVLNEDLTSEDLGFYSEYTSMSASSKEPDYQDTKMRQRVMTNIKDIAGLTNLEITNYKWITNNKFIREHGISNQYLVGGAAGYQEDGNGACCQKDIEIQDDSAQGTEYRDNYSFQRSAFIGYEMGNADDGNTPVLMQEKINENYFRKIRQKRLKVDLARTNMGLQRGTLISILFGEQSDREKRLLVGQEGMEDAETRQAIQDGYTVLNPYLSGIYYIDGMEFTYDNDSKNITQTLFLIKKTTYENINSKANPIIDELIDNES